MLIAGVADREERVKKRDAMLAAENVASSASASRPRIILYTQVCSLSCGAQK